MSVYFVYRSHYDTPALNHLQKFDNSSVLDWFQQIWQGGAARADDRNYVPGLFGCDVYGFNSLFEAIEEKKLPPPKTIKDLEKVLNEHLYVEGEILVGEHCVQVLTDDDELQIAYFFFDDNYVQARPDRARFLLQEEWKLPADFSADSIKLNEPCEEIQPQPRGGNGTVYMAFLSYEDSLNLDEMLGPFCIHGIRLPNFVRYMTDTMPSAAADKFNWPFELRLVRSQLSGESEHATVADLERALEGVSNFPIAQIMNAVDCREFGKQSIAQAKLEIAELSKAAGGHDSGLDAPLIQIDEHVAQVSINTDDWDGTKLFQRWIFFDDLWAGKNPELANSILTYAKRWDVLS